MFFAQWLRQIISAADTDKALLEQRLAEVEKKLASLAHEEPGCGKDQSAPAIVIEQLHIDKLVVEKLEHSNNFGALGIKELGGKLNIGVNYTGPIPENIQEEMFPWVNKPESKPPAAGKETKKDQTGSGPACNIRARPAH
ncbi:hypothetical protein [Paenibacillus hamazuiensis]|uniref:hypothetical protein n=1 Tax=Paenibacillus hamazuiensis TaxID=2936508 RepID=UPI0020102782|nr:hypothetical protein [Paenibacillus hamazuiensis]